MRTEVFPILLHKIRIMCLFWQAEPLTGAVILSEEYVRANTDHVVENLAEEILMAGQKLCSSPTHGVCIGSNDGANNFANKLIEKLDSKARIIEKLGK